MKTILKIKTWSCACGYAQDFDPTQENQDLHFNNDSQFRLSNLKANECPSCGLKGLKGAMTKETNPDKKTTVTIMGEEDIEDEILKDDEEKTKQGKVKMTGQEKADYRAKRKQDIKDAIIKFKLLEDL